MKQLFSSKEIKNFELTLADNFIASHEELQKRAGIAAYEFARLQYPDRNYFLIICGTGNNGRDGLIFAEKAVKDGMKTAIFTLESSLQQISHEFNSLGKTLMPVSACNEEINYVLKEHKDKAILIDAIFGINFRSEDIPIHITRLMKQMNDSGLPIVSLDIPSGLNADSGLAEYGAIAATKTATFIAYKRGMFTNSGKDCSGEISLLGLDVDEQRTRYPNKSFLLDASLISDHIAPRMQHSHKGMYGTTLCIGGNYGCGGALILASEAALKAGSGSVIAATRSDHVAPLLARSPEVMAHGIADPKEIMPLLEASDAIAIGPGLGTDEWAQDLLEICLSSTLPLVIDADALTLISESQRYERKNKTIFTPHPGEAAKLLNTSVEAIQSDRFDAALKIAVMFQVTCVLKGAGTCIACDTDREVINKVFVSQYGSPTLATAGSGDVLTGTIAGLIAQNRTDTHHATLLATKIGVMLHGLAGERIAQKYGTRGAVASDIVNEYRAIQNQACS